MNYNSQRVINRILTFLSRVTLKLTLLCNVADTKFPLVYILKTVVKNTDISQIGRKMLIGLLLRSDEKLSVHH